jgi:hypothetical protein
MITKLNRKPIRSVNRRCYYEVISTDADPGALLKDEHGQWWLNGQPITLTEELEDLVRYADGNGKT